MSKRISQQEFIERVVSCTKNVEIIGQYTVERRILSGTSDATFEDAAA